MIRKHGFALVLFWSLMAIIDASARPRETGFLNRVVEVDGVKYRYQVYVPQDWNGNRKWPIILFLHGAGERGEDGLLQTQVGIATAVRLHLERFPAVIVMPQCRKNVWWTEPGMEAQALKALAQSAKEFKGDPDRTYLTGLSMGGYGTWAIAAKYPGRFAAIAPICGGVREPRRGTNPPPVAEDPYGPVAAKIGKTPVWIFHGGDDKTVPVTESREMNRALKAAGADPKYTEYEGVGHNSWDRAYGEPEFMPWLLAQRKH